MELDIRQGCLETSYMLNGAGYRGTEPQMLAADDKALLEYLYHRSEDSATIVDILYRTHRPELLTLEQQAENDSSEAGLRMREFLHYVRRCILSWVVSTAARPRTRLGLIDSERPQKRYLVANVFTDHLKCLLSTPEYFQLQATVLRHETHEISLGELAQRGGQEQRLSMQIGQLPNQLAERVEPQLASLQLDLSDE
eukprot:7391292-Prymnesium_polylepis.1